VHLQVKIAIMVQNSKSLLCIGLRRLGAMQKPSKNEQKSLEIGASR
jgi:hypothetical protein